MSGPPTPSPQLVGAHWVLGDLATEQVPGWACDWLVAGHRGRALSRLAGLPAGATQEFGDTLSDALAECGIRWTDEDRQRGCAEIMVAFCDLARSYLDGSAGEDWVVERVLEFLDNNPASPGHELPLGELALHEREGAGQIWRRRQVEQACRRQVSIAPGLL